MAKEVRRQGGNEEKREKRHALAPPIGKNLVVGT